MGAIVRGKIQRGDIALWDGATKTVSRVDATGGTVTGLTVGDSVDVLQVFGSGTSRTRGTIATATGTIGSTNTALLFSTGTWTIDDDLTIPSNFTCLVPAGCVFDVASGKTLTLAGSTFLQNSTWSSGAGTAVITGGWPGVIGRTAAEVSAGVFPTDYSYDPGNIMRYGADPAYSADSGPAIQAAMNVHTYEAAGQMTTVDAPRGHYKVSTDIFGYYDSVLNPNMNTDADQGAVTSWVIQGGGRGKRKNYQVENYEAGTYFDFDAGKRFIVSDANDDYSTGSEGGYVTRDWGILDVGFVCHHDTGDGYALVVDGARDGEIKVAMGNDGDGTAALFDNCCCDINVNMLFTTTTANDGNGTGLHIKQTLSGGGSMFYRLDFSGLEYPFIGGQTYDADRTKWAGNTIFETLNIDNCDQGGYLRHGFINIEIRHFWAEQNHRESLVIEQGCGLRVTDSGDQEGTIEIKKAHTNASTDQGALDDYAHFRFGKSGGTDLENAHGNIVMHQPSTSGVYNPTAVIRRHNSPENGRLVIKHPTAHSNGGVFMVLDDEAQIAPVIIQDTAGLYQLANTRLFTDDFDATNDLRHWVSFATDAGMAYELAEWGTATGGGPDFNYSAAQTLPHICRSNISSTNMQEIYLPTSTQCVPFFSKVLKLSTGAANYIRFNPGANGVINNEAAGTALDVFGQDITILIHQTSERGEPVYQINVAVNQVAQVANASAGSAAEIDLIRDALEDAGIMRKA